MGRVVGDLGWSSESLEPGTFEIHEDPTRLHCHCSPLRAHLTFTPAAGGTELRIDGEVPGWGPVASKHVRDGTDLLARRVGLEAVSRGRRGA